MESNTPTTSAPKAPVPAKLPPQDQPNPDDPSKKVIVGLGIGLGIVFLLIVGLILAGVVFWSGGVSKNDYRKAATAVTSVRSSYSSMRLNLSLYGNGIGGYNSSRSSVERFNTSFGRYKAQAKELGELKALKDDEVKRAYDNFKTKNDLFLAQIDKLLPSIEVLNDAHDKCQSSNFSSSIYSSSFRGAAEDVTRFDRAVQPCQAALTRLKDADSKTFGEAVDKASASITKMRSILVQMTAASKADDRTKYYTLQSDMIRAYSDVRSANSAIDTAFRQQLKQSDVEGALGLLHRVVATKVAEQY